MTTMDSSSLKSSCTLLQHNRCHTLLLAMELALVKALLCNQLSWACYSHANRWVLTGIHCHLHSIGRLHILDSLEMCMLGSKRFRRFYKCRQVLELAVMVVLGLAVMVVLSS